MLEITTESGILLNDGRYLRYYQAPPTEFNENSLWYRNIQNIPNNEFVTEILNSLGLSIVEIEEEED